MQRISLALLINLHVMDPPLIQVLGFKDTYIWLKDDNPSQKKRGTSGLTKALNANFKVTLLYSLFLHSYNFKQFSSKRISKFLIFLSVLKNFYLKSMCVRNDIIFSTTNYVRTRDVCSREIVRKRRTFEQFAFLPRKDHPKDGSTENCETI